jgi:hypothetical protein
MGKNVNGPGIQGEHQVSYYLPDSEIRYNVPRSYNYFKEAVMKPFIALFAAVLLAGCVAPADNQTLQKEQDTKTVEQAYALCKSTVDATPEAMRLSEYFVLGKNRDANYLAKIAHKSYATDEQIADIHKYHTGLKICRDKAVDDLQPVDNDYAILVTDYFTEDDKITAEVVNKKITIGEANRKVKKSEYYYSLKGYDLKEVPVTQ